MKTSNWLICVAVMAMVVPTGCRRPESAGAAETPPADCSEAIAAAIAHLPRDWPLADYAHWATYNRARPPACRYANSTRGIDADAKDLEVITGFLRALPAECRDAWLARAVVNARRSLGCRMDELGIDQREGQSIGGGARALLVAAVQAADDPLVVSAASDALELIDLRRAVIDLSEKVSRCADTSESRWCAVPIEPPKTAP